MGSVHIIIVQLNMSELDLNTKKDKLKKNINAILLNLKVKLSFHKLNNSNTRITSTRLLLYIGSNFMVQLV